MRLITIIALFGLIIHTPLIYAQSVRAVLDKNAVFVGESVILTVEVQGDVGGESPEVGVLTESFEILGSQSQTQVQIINNQQTVLKSWQFELEPKTAGDLAIPALTIGPRLKTPPLQLTVLPPSQDDDISQDIFIELSTEPLNPYVQEQVRYRERIFLAVPFEGGPRREGVFSDVLVQPLGEQKRYVEIRDGRNFQVFESNFALIPEKSGPITLPRLALRGRVGSRQPGQLTINRGRRVQIQSEELVLQVRPRPTEYSDKTQQAWLPSWELNLSEQWHPDPPIFRVGEPVTRTLLLQAKGLDAGQLPQLDLPLTPISGVNIYPDQAQSTTHSDAEWLLGRREQKIALVPTQAGELNLPEITLEWWNTQQDQAQTAIIPARTVMVLPAVGSMTTPPDLAIAEEVDTSPALTPVVPPNQPALQQAILPVDARVWQGLSLALFIIWLGTIVAWWHERQRRSAITHNTAPKPNQRSLRQAVYKACQAHDAPSAAHSLLQWAAQQWPQHPPTNLGALAVRCPSIAPVILELDRALYGASAELDHTWQGTDLWRAVQPGLGSVKDGPKRNAERDDGLAPLYLHKV